MRARATRESRRGTSATSGGVRRSESRSVTVHHHENVSTRRATRGSPYRLSSGSGIDSLGRARVGRFLALGIDIHRGADDFQRFIGAAVDARRNPARGTVHQRESSTTCASREDGYLCTAVCTRYPTRYLFAVSMPAQSFCVSRLLSSFQSHAAVVFSVRTLRHADGDHDRGFLSFSSRGDDGTHRSLLKRPDGRRAQSERGCL